MALRLRRVLFVGALLVGLIHYMIILPSLGFTSWISKNTRMVTGSLERPNRPTRTCGVRFAIRAYPPFFLFISLLITESEV